MIVSQHRNAELERYQRRAGDPGADLGPAGPAGGRVAPDEQPPAHARPLRTLPLHSQVPGTLVHEGQEALRPQEHHHRLQLHSGGIQRMAFHQDLLGRVGHDLQVMKRR